MNWISVDDQMPEERILVLAFNGVEIEVCYYEFDPYDNSIEWLNKTGFEKDVKFWIPLPPKPEVDNEVD